MLEQQLVHTIKQLTKKRNKDNISRTKAYERYFTKYPEIKWALLAGLVSRNAGWNMCDLESKSFSHLLTSHFRRQLFLTYEEANWRIFQDAYPQLLLYHFSIQYNRPLFYLCKKLYITKFMEKQWERFWKHRNERRLAYALIINEQHIIEKPVIQKRFFVFHSVIFLLQDRLHHCKVLFPTCYGELYGFSVSHFQDVDARIHLGKKLYELLFSPQLFPYFYQFMMKTEPSGSRYDYGQYSHNVNKRTTPILRLTYPIVSHKPCITEQWDVSCTLKSKWFRKPKILVYIPFTKHKK